jgi:adenosylcobinamide-GDP ribazoletransferase
MINDIKVAFAFLTRIPIKHGSEVNITRSAVWFPLVGFIIGLVTGATYLLLSNLLPSLPASAIAILLGVLISGSFHQDGLADIFDGLVGGWDKKQRLEILKDSRHGTYGVTTLVLQFILQIVVLGEFSPIEGMVALIAMHTLARLAPIFLMLAPAAEGSQGMGASLSREVTLKQVAGSLLLTFILLSSFIGLYLLPMMILMLAIIFLFYLYVKAKIGGIVGDALGAAEQIAETSILITLLFLSFRGFEWIIFI